MGLGLRGKFGGLLLVGVTLGVIGCERSMSDADRWAALPYTMGCAFMSGDPAPDGPLSTQALSARLSHQGGQRLRLDVEFLFSVPPPPRMISTRVGPTEAPGTIWMTFLVRPTGRSDDKVITIDRVGSPHAEWRADASEFVGDEKNLLESVSTSDRVLSFILDLSSIEEALGRSEFEADVDIETAVSGRLDRSGVAEGPFPIKSIECRRGTPARTLLPSTAVPDSPAGVPTPAPSPSRSPRVTTVAPDSNLRWRFSSPTGNIACDLDGTVDPAIAACEVREHSYEQEVKPDCDPGWANRFTLSEGHPVEANCYPSSEFGTGLPVQEYGRPLTVGSITCVIEESSGVRCLDESSGHSFQVARQEYRVS